MLHLYIYINLLHKCYEILKFPFNLPSTLEAAILGHIFTCYFFSFSFTRYVN